MRRLAVLALVALIPAAVASAGRLAAARHTTTETWNLASDMLANSSGASPTNPFADFYGNSGTWHMLVAPSTTRDPSTYVDIPNTDLTRGACGVPGIDDWQDSSLASAWVNTTSSTIDGTTCAPFQVLPARSAFLHPGPSNLVMIGWKSPIAGTVSISGSFSDADCGGGDGVTWYVEKGTADLASGSVACTTESLPAPLDVPVSPGDFIYFVVDPNANYLYDATQVDVTLAADVAPPPPPPPPPGPVLHALQITKTGTGSGSVTCAGGCASSYADGSTVTLTATPDNGSSFAGWSGCDTTSGDSCTVTLATDRTVDATFDALPPPPQSDLSLTGTGDAVVAPGGTFAATYTVTNGGPDEAHAVRVSFQLPEGAHLIDVTPSQGTCTNVTDGIACVVGTLAKGSAATVAVSAAAPSTGTDITMSATASADEVDPAPVNQTASVTVAIGCAQQIAVDAVTVLADCISREGDGTYLAAGHARFANGAEIRADGTSDDANLVVDPSQHRISLPAGASGQLAAGGRPVASGTFSIDTQPLSDPTSGLSGLVRVNGLSHPLVELSGWGFADDAANTSLFLAPSTSGGGAVLDGTLKVPVFAGASLTGKIAVQVGADGRRNVRTGDIHYNYYLLGNSAWQIQEIGLHFLDGGDLFTGEGLFKAPFLGNAVVQNVVVKNGRVDSFSVTYDGTGCTGCGAGDPVIGSILRLKYAQLQGFGLGGISYATSTSSSPFGSVMPVACHFGTACPPPPQINGTVLLTALENRVIAIGSFTDYLSGRFHAQGRIFFAPAIPDDFHFPPFAQGVAPYVQFARTGMDFASGSMDYTPPHRYVVRGTWTVLPDIDLLEGSFALGFDPPHWTGIGALTLKVPSESPIFAGKKVAGAEGLISDEAAAADATFKICAPSWLGGGCASTDLSVAWLWNCSCFHFFDNIDNYATVAGVTDLRRTAGVAAPPFVVPSGWRLASVRVTSDDGVPNVRLTSPVVDGRRLRLSAAASSEPGNTTGGLVSVSPARHEEVFLVAEPPAGHWQVTRLSGPEIARVELAHGSATTELVPASLEAAASDRSVRLAWSSTAAEKATLAVWATQSTDGEGQKLLADGLPASGTARVPLDGLTGGRWRLFGVLTKGGAPVATAYWPQAVSVVDPLAPAAPSRGSARTTRLGVLVRWSDTRARAYVVTATPVPAQSGPPLEFASAAAHTLLHLHRGRAYDLTVASVARDGRRSTATPLGRIRLGGAPGPFVAGTPQPWAQVGVTWAFAPRVGAAGRDHVRLRLAAGPRGMRLVGGVVVWRPSSVPRGPVRFALRATSGTATVVRSYALSVAARGVVLPLPASGIAVTPAALPAGGGTFVVRASGLARVTNVLVDGRPVAATHEGDGLEVRVRCLAPGAHGVTLVRSDAVRMTAPQGLVAFGGSCR